MNAPTGYTGGWRTRVLTDTQDAEVASLYLGGAKLWQLAKQFGVSEKAIRGSLKRSRVASRPRGRLAGDPVGRKLTPEEEAQIVEDFKAGLTIVAIASAHRVSAGRVTIIRKRHGLPERPRNWALTPEQEAEVAEAYLGGATLPVLARRFEVTKDPILGALKRHGVKTRPPGRIPHTYCNRGPCVLDGGHDGDCTLGD